MSLTLAAERLIGLDVDLPGSAELVEVVDVVGADVDLQRVEDVADADAQGLALGPVDVEVEPGRVGAGAVAQAGQARRFVAAGDDLVADALQFGQAEIAAILDDELEAAGGAQAVDGGAAEDATDDGPLDPAPCSACAIFSAMASALELRILRVFRTA